MGKLYFAKLNINNDIYDVYDKKKQITVLLDKIYLAVNASIILDDEKGGKYKFFDIDSDKKHVITAKLGHIKPGVHSTYDPDKDTAIDLKDPNKIEYVVFHLNIDDELIGYTTNLDIRKNSFLGIFEELIEKESNIGISLKLINDSEKFDDKINLIETLKKINIKMIPPNDDEDEFKDLFSVSPIRYKEANITQATQILSTRKKDGLKKDSRAVKGFIKGTKLGYAEAKFFGTGYNGTSVEIDTSEDTPRYAIINQNNMHDNITIASTANRVFNSIKLQFAKQRAKKE